jgi:hypothetical protein
MADFTKNSVADMAAANPGLNMGTSGSLRETDYASENLWGQRVRRARWGVRGTTCEVPRAR